MTSEADTRVSAPPPWNSGDVVSRYTLLAKIAVGGMAEIWLARQAGPRGFEKVVVIKRIIDSFSQDPEFVEMFLDEARIAAQLNHPNIVQIYDLGEHHNAWYIAMEYLAGEHFAAVMRASAKMRRPVPLRLLMKIISSAAEGLSHAHTKAGVDGKPLGVVHRDVSPQNLVITYDGQVKVVDFGIAKAANRGFHTAAGQVKGKFAYMAPEQAGGQPLDARADLFALGVIAYEVATRARLFKADDDMQVLQMVLNPEPITPAHLKNPEVPEALSLVLGKAIERRPDDRYPDLAAFQRALDGWLATQGVPSSAEVAAVMQSLFAERMQSRANLIETAGRGELTPSGAQAAVRHDTGRSMPGVELTKSKPKVRGPISRAAPLIAVGVVLVAGLGYWLSRDSAVPAVVPPVKVSTGARLSVQTTPPGAQVTLDGKDVGKAPLTIDDVPPGNHQVMALLEGHTPAGQSVSLAADDKASVALSLAEKPAEKVPVLADPNGPPDKKTPPVAPKAAAKGKLRLNTNPWTRVSLGNKVLGETPLIELPLPAGRHLLKLVNEEKKINTTIEVEIKAGQTTVKQLSF